MTILKTDTVRPSQSSGAEESLVIKIDCVRAVESTSYTSDPAKRTRFSNEVSQMVRKCETDTKDEMVRKRTVKGKPLLVISPEAESSITIMFERNICCYEIAVRELYIAIAAVLKHWTSGALDNGPNAYEIRVRVPKPPKPPEQLIPWQHPSSDSQIMVPHSNQGSTSVFPEPSLIDQHSEGDFDPRAVLNMRTNEILSLEPAKFEKFREWLASSGVRGARDLLKVLSVQQELEQQRAELQSRIYTARRSRANMFGYIGTLLFDLMHGGSVPSK